MRPLSDHIDARVDAVRRFNRFYTGRIGLLKKGYLNSALSLSEIRVLYEIAHRDGVTASDIVRDLELDAGYLSRMLAAFEKRGLIRKTRSNEDGRQSHLALTPKGRTTFAPLEKRSHDDIAAMLEGLSGADQTRVVAAMATIETLLAKPAAPPSPILVRPPGPGDIGWVVGIHARLYAQEYGWDSRFEALVAEIAGAFLKNFDPKRERCFIAEMDGRPVGSAFLVRDSDEVARLRLLIVDPVARGRGLGKRMTQECIGFAREAGYRRLTLWTHSVLTAARHIYDQAGFKMVGQGRHASFGKELVDETWELTLFGN
jgi:DNA-binding MarR family transcriptional regulator/GNAT superfamily N-acetyltransferase